MTSIRASLVDVYVLRGVGSSLQCLVLRRAPGGRCPGSWESVHGHIEPAERPTRAAERELEEETGLIAARLYNLSRVELFYQHRSDEVALVPVFPAFVADRAGGEARLPVFAAFGADDAAVGLGPEHDGFEWLSPAAARARFAWPRERRALDD